MAAPTPTLYFHNEAARLTLHPAGEYIHLHWPPGSHADEARQQVMNQVLAALQTQGWQKLLAPQQVSFPFSVELQVWLQLDWRPRAVQAGYRYCALVQPHELTSQMVLIDLVHAHKGPWLHYYCSTDEQAAQTWLVAQPRVA